LVVGEVATLPARVSETFEGRRVDGTA
jgi:hypothetical protein